MADGPGASSPLVTIRTEGSVCLLLLDDGARRNPLSDPMLEALNAALVSPEARGSAVVVLRGADGFFSGGGDIRQFQADLTTDASEQFAATGTFRELFLLLDAVEAITIAVVEGQALGGGCGVAAACDIVLASAPARFGCPEVNLGAFPMIITPALVRAIGARATTALAASGRVISADRAQQLGLVTEVFPADQFDEQVEAYLSRLGGIPARVLRLGKLSVRAAERGDYRTGLESGSLLRSLLFSSPAFHRGVDDFVSRSRG
jgi:enoyl-CoA hydratase/carnithine racemase